MSPPAQVQPQTSADKKKGVMGVISEGFEADGPGEPLSRAPTAYYSSSARKHLAAGVSALTVLSSQRAHQCLAVQAA